VLLPLVSWESVRGTRHSMLAGRLLVAGLEQLRHHLEFDPAG